MTCVVESKGVVDLYGVQRVAAFIRESGLVDFNFVVKSEQESSIVAMLEQAIRRSGRHGSVVPEASAVGESASNSRAERTIQAVEDLLRVHKHALEARLGKRVPLILRSSNGWWSMSRISSPSTPLTAAG